MKKFIAVLTFLYSGYYASAQTLIVNKTLFIGTSSASTGCASAIPTQNKSIIISGATFGNGTDDIPATSFAKENVYIAKVDSNMQLLWLKLYGGSQDDYSKSMCTASDGGYIILANSESADGDVPANNMGRSAWVIKVDNEGNKVWSKTYGGPADNEALSIAATPDGGYIILGTANMAGGDIPFHYTTSQFVDDWFVLKIDATGNMQWLKVYGGSNDEDIYGSILVANDGYYLVGSSQSVDHDCIDTSWHSGVNTKEDYYVLKLDFSGNIVWSKSYGSTDYDNVNNALLDEVDSSIVIVGTSRGHDHMISENNGDWDIWVIKVSKDGALIWEKSLGGAKMEMHPAISKTVNDDYCIYTQTFSANLGREDTWLFIIDNSGKDVLNKVIGGNNYDMPTSVLPFSNYQIAIGTSASPFFTEGTSAFKHGSAGETFVSKLYYFPTAVDQNEKSTAMLAVYPNPVHGKTRILIPRNEQGELFVIDNLGKKIFSLELKENVEHVDLSTKEWSSGQYVVVWKNNLGMTYTQKIVNN